MSNLYASSQDSIIEIKDLVNYENYEVEDLIPYTLLEKGIWKLFNTVEESFEESYDDHKPIVPQIENFAGNNNIALPKGWKVELAKSAKRKLLSNKTPDFDKKYKEIWKKLFAVLQP